MSWNYNATHAANKRRHSAWRWILLWLPPCVWMGIIFAASSMPASALPSPPEFVMLLAHFLEYFILGILFFRALNGGFRSPLSLAALAVAFLFCVVYGVLDEFHQLFVPGRVPDLLDLASDTVGAATAILVSWLALTAFRRAGSRVD